MAQSTCSTARQLTLQKGIKNLIQSVHTYDPIRVFQPNNWHFKRQIKILFKVFIRMTQSACFNPTIDTTNG